MPPKQVDQTAASDRRPPKDVREACQLILAAFTVGAFSLIPGTGSAGEVAALVFAILVLGGITLWLARKVWLGRNWARWAMLAYLGPTWLLSAFDFNGAMADPLIAISTIVTVGMEVFACWMLFFGLGAQWFEARDKGGVSDRVP